MLAHCAIRHSAATAFCVQVDGRMNDDARNGERRPRPLPARGTCPHCLNPHTVVADESYRGLMRFCPMCDYSWVIGDGGEEDAAPKRGAQPLRVNLVPKR